MEQGGQEDSDWRCILKEGPAGLLKDWRWNMRGREKSRTSSFMIRAIKEQRDIYLPTILVEHLLCARRYFRYQGHSKKKRKSLPSLTLRLEWEEN